MRPRGGRGLTPRLADGPLAGGPGGLAPAGPAHKTPALLSFPSLFKGLRLTGEGEGTAGPARGGQWEPREGGAEHGVQVCTVHPPGGPKTPRLEAGGQEVGFASVPSGPPPARQSHHNAAIEDVVAHIEFTGRDPRPREPDTRRHMPELPRRLWPAGQLCDHGHFSP